MIKALIIEDEVSAREELSAALEKYEDIEIADQCGDLFSAMKQIRQHKPDIIFLDICLPGHDYDVPTQSKDWPELGFTLLDYMDIDEHQPHIIIVSSYSRYTLRAFEANVLDYLQKPVLDDRLETTIERIREQCSETKKQPAPFPDRSLERLPVYSNNRVRFIKLEEIEFVESRGPAGIYVVCEDKSYYTELTLKLILEKTNFFQSQKQFIVNPDAVLEFGRVPDTNRATIYTHSKKEVPVARGFRAAVMQRLGLKGDDVN